MTDDYSYKIAVSGWGTPHPDLIADCLRDQFPRYDGHPYRLLVAAVQERLTSGVQAVIEYAWDAEWVVVAVVEPGGHTGVVGDLLADGADDRIMVEPGEITNTILNELAASIPNSCLIIMSSACEFDPETLNLARLCANAGVPVLDLSEGLIEIGDIDLEAFETPEPAKGEEETAVVEVEVEEASEPAVAPPAVATRPVACHAIPVGDWSRLRQLHAEMADLLRESPGEESPEDPAALPKYTEPGCCTSRPMRTEFWDKNTGQWKPRTRGRLKHGTKTRQVPRD